MHSLYWNFNQLWTCVHFLCTDFSREVSTCLIGANTGEKKTQNLRHLICLPVSISITSLIILIWSYSQIKPVRNWIKEKLRSSFNKKNSGWFSLKLSKKCFSVFLLHGITMLIETDAVAMGGTASSRERQPVCSTFSRCDSPMSFFPTRSWIDLDGHIDLWERRQKGSTPRSPPIVVLFNTQNYYRSCLYRETANWRISDDRVKF